MAKKWEQFKIVLLFMDHPVSRKVRHFGGTNYKQVQLNVLNIFHTIQLYLTTYPRWNSPFKAEDIAKTGLSISPLSPPPSPPLPSLSPKPPPVPEYHSSYYILKVHVQCHRMTSKFWTSVRQFRRPQWAEPRPSAMVGRTGNRTGHSFHCSVRTGPVIWTELTHKPASLQLAK